MERDLRAILAAALEAADPGAAVRRFMRVEGGAVVVGERRIVVLAVGKDRDSPHRFDWQATTASLSGAVISL